MNIKSKLKSKRILISAVALVAVLGVGGVAVAAAVAGDDELSGGDLERAREAALAHVGEGTVTDAERGDGDDIEEFQVEVTRDNGSEVDVLALGQARREGRLVNL